MRCSWFLVLVLACSPRALPPLSAPAPLQLAVSDPAPPVPSPTPELSPTSEPPSPTPSSEPSPEPSSPEPSSPEPSPTPASEPTPAPLPVSESAPLATVTPLPPPIEPACRGTDLDLVKLSASAACTVASEYSGIPETWQVALPEAVKVTISPVRLVVKSGATLDVAIVLTNTTDAELVLVLDDSCGRLREVNATMHDAGGRRVDSDLRCGRLGGCGNSAIRVVLAARGTARIPFVVDARVEEECRRGKPVKRGTYDLQVFSGVGKWTRRITVR
jgi:hypothetical protein